MLAKLRGRRPSHATVVAYLALFTALGGGAYAATSLPKNSVGTKQLKDNAVISSKIKDGGVHGADIARRAVTGSKVGHNTLNGFNINESTFGTVPDAAKLGGNPASDFVGSNVHRAESAIQAGTALGTTRYIDEACPPGEAPL